MKLEHFLTPYTKINSKWIKDLNITPETIKLLEENIGKTLSDINHSRILYDPPPRILEIKAKINKWYIYTMEYYSAIKKNTLESVLMRWMKLEPIIQSEVSQKEKHQYSILTHIYGI